VNEHVVAKFWHKVEQRLRNRDGVMYYAGGTLCIDFTKGGIGLNLDGKGFVFGTSPLVKNDRVYQPRHILELVRNLYLEIKGSTDHFKRAVGV
jgi:hypothetical protein